MFKLISISVQIIFTIRIKYQVVYLSRESTCMYMILLGLLYNNQRISFVPTDEALNGYKDIRSPFVLLRKPRQTCLLLYVCF